MSLKDRMTIALLLDNPLRDLPGLVLVGLTLCSRGHRALFVPVNILSDAWASNPDFFMLNYHRKSNDYQVRRILNRGMRFIVLDTEGSPYSLDQHIQIISDDTELRERTSAVCIWGEPLAQHLISCGYYKPHQVHVTGSPRHDFYHPSLAEAARERSRSAYSGDDGFILITASNGMANPRFRTPEQQLAESISKTNLGAEYCRGIQSEQAALLVAIINLTERLALDFSQIPIILRPHPFENPAPYEVLQKRYPNVRVIQEGTIDGFLLRARCAIIRAGTTPLEAALAGVPVFSPNWIPVRYGISQEAESVMNHCASYEDLHEKISLSFAVSYSREISGINDCQAIVRSKFFLCDGQSHIRVADIIEETMHELTRKRTLLGLRIWGALTKIARRKTIMSWENSQKHFNSDSIRQVIEMIQHLPLDGLTHLKTAVKIEQPKSFLGRLKTLRSRSVLLSPS